MSMSASEIDALATAYIAQYLERRADGDAWDQLTSLLLNSPVDAWQVIERILELPFDSVHLAWIGAGPIEELLRMYPSEFVEIVRNRARTDSRLREALEYANVSERTSALLRESDV
jgi:hypothetical protein